MTPSGSPSPPPVTSIVDAFGGPTTFWPAVLTAAITLFAALLGSNVIGTLFQGWFTHRGEKRNRSTASGRRVLASLSRMQTLTLRLGADPASTRRRDERLMAQRSSELETLAALTGNREIVSEARAYVGASESFASGDPAVNAVAQRAAFRAVVDRLVDFLR